MDSAIEECLVAMVSRPDSTDTQNHLTRDLRTLIDEIAGPAPTPLETMLATNAGYCWMWMRILECRFLNYADNPNATEAWTASMMGRIDSAHKRFTSAVRLLATVRRLAAAPSPGVNVNILNQLGGASLPGGAALASLTDAVPTAAPLGGVAAPASLPEPMPLVS
jgi:hypothetical protein